MDVLNSTTTPENNKAKPQTSAPAIKPPPQTSSNPSSFLHPQAQGSSHGVHTGTQAPQLLLQTWHGEESILHHQSLRGAKSVKKNQSDRHASDNKHVTETRDTAVSPFTEASLSQRHDSRSQDRSTVLNSKQGTQGKQSAVIPSDTSGTSVPPLTLQDLDSMPIHDSTNLVGAPTGNFNEGFQNGHLQNNSHFLPENAAVNRNNNANQNNLTSQTGPSANQNGFNEDEYDTIPTRDSDEFIPSNSSSSHHEGATASSAPRTIQEDPRQGPPPDYHNTYAFAHPQMPPLLRLDIGGPQSFRPPPPPPLVPPGHGFPPHPFTPREVWGTRLNNQANIHPPKNEFPYDRHPDHEGQSSYRRDGHQHHDTRQENINLFLPPIPLLTLDNKGPTYQPPPEGPRPQDHMPLLTFDPKPSYHHHHDSRPPSNLPYAPRQADVQFFRGPQRPSHPPSNVHFVPPQAETVRDSQMPPHPMPLLHLDQPPQPYLFKSSRGGVGTVQLIPPEEIIAFEQQKYKEKVEKLRQQQENAEDQYVEGEVGEGHLPLLHLDTEQDDMDNVSRYVIPF